jgi:fatty-acyl-CoA synthase
VSRVLATCGHRPARVLLVRPGTIPKTSSGKIQRSRLGHLIGAGALQDQVVHGPGAHGGA